MQRQNANSSPDQPSPLAKALPPSELHLLALWALAQEWIPTQVFHPVLCLEYSSCRDSHSQRLVIDPHGPTDRPLPSTPAAIAVSPPRLPASLPLPHTCSALTALSLRSVLCCWSLSTCCLLLSPGRTRCEGRALPVWLDNQPGLEGTLSEFDFQLHHLLIVGS